MTRDHRIEATSKTGRDCFLLRFPAKLLLLHFTSATYLYKLSTMQGMVDEAKAFLETAEGQDFERDMQESFLAGSPTTQQQWAQRILAEKDRRQGQGNAGQDEDSTSGMNKGALGSSL